MRLEFSIVYYLDLLLIINFFYGQEVICQVNCWHSSHESRDKKKLHVTAQLVAERGKSCSSPFVTMQTLCQELCQFSLQSQQKSVNFFFSLQEN